MLIRFNNYFTFALNDSQENLGPYFIIKHKPKDYPGLIGIFDEIFDYFLKDSKPFIDFI